MIIRLLVRMFGSVWHLKYLCQSRTNPLVKKLLINLYNAYQREKEAVLHGMPDSMEFHVYRTG